MAIRIDELPGTVLHSLLHELPAMKDGLTVKLTVAQILGLLDAGVLDFDTGPYAGLTLNAALNAKADDTDLLLYLLKAGGTLSGDLSIGGNDLRGVATLNDGPVGGSRDALINGGGAISQRTYTTVADDTYWCDRHYVLTQTAAITPTIIADVADGLPSMMRLTQSQASAQRMGNAQIVEASKAKQFRGKQVTLGGWLRCSAAQAIRYAVIEWTGTADSPISDVVNSWTNGSFAAGQFFIGTTTTVAAVGTITPSANTLTKWSLTANVSSSCNNLIVVMWTETTAAQNVTLDMAWGLVLGDATGETWPYSPRDYQQELMLCQRYFRQMFFGWRGSVTASSTTGESTQTIQPPMRIATPAATETNITNANFPATGGVLMNNLGQIYATRTATVTSADGVWRSRIDLDAEL